MSNYRIAASILAADFARLGEEVTQVLTAGADWVHVDVMDHHYVPNLTVGPLVCEALRKYGVSAPLDVHLMVKPVDPMIATFAAAGATWITFHPEASEHVHRTIQLIHDHGCKAGIALNPATPLHVLDHILNNIDMVLIMSVNPGFGGQQFIPESLEKIRLTQQRILASGRDIILAVDGGVSAHNIATLAEAGADTFVAGTAIFKSQNYLETINILRSKLATVGC